MFNEGSFSKKINNLFRKNTGETTCIKISPGMEMPITKNVPILIGRDPEDADYLDPEELTKCKKVKLMIGTEIGGYLPRAALLILRNEKTTKIAVPHQNHTGITTYGTGTYEPEIISPGEKAEFDNGKLERLVIDCNGHRVQLRYTNEVGKQQFFRLEVDPT